MPPNTAVAAAIDEVREMFIDTEVVATPDGNGGAWVQIENVQLGDVWNPGSSWLGFHIANTYPYAEVYPHFIGHDLRLTANGELTEAVTASSFGPNSTPALQVSRRSNRWNAAEDTAALKALKVVQWLSER